MNRKMIAIAGVDCPGDADAGGRAGARHRGPGQGGDRTASDRGGPEAGRRGRNADYSRTPVFCRSGNRVAAGARRRQPDRQARRPRRVFRDNEGRTRREQAGPGGVGETITIWDPVASTSFTLDPATKTALPERPARFRVVGPPGSGWRWRRWRQRRGEWWRLRIRRRARRKGAAAGRDGGDIPRRRGQMKQVIERAASGGGTTVREDLGSAEHRGRPGDGYARDHGHPGRRDRQSAGDSGSSRSSGSRRTSRSSS